MKREVRTLLRALVQLVERDVADLREALVEVDERCADLQRRVDNMPAPPKPEAPAYPIGCIFPNFPLGCGKHQGDGLRSGARCAACHPFGCMCDACRPEGHSIRVTS